MTRSTGDEDGTRGDIAEKRALIVAYEAGFARALAARVVEKPVVSWWMIILPLLLVHYVYRLLAFRKGCAAFAAHYLKPRHQALALALGPPGDVVADCADDVSTAGVLRQLEARQVAILAGHFRRLLAAEGNDYRSLVLAGYADASAYDDYLDDIEAVHDEIDRAILAASEQSDVITDMVTRFRTIHRNLYREEARNLFGPEAWPGEIAK